MGASVGITAWKAGRPPALSVVPSCGRDHRLDRAGGEIRGRRRQAPRHVHRNGEAVQYSPEPDEVDNASH